jgi:hypothetical protein
MNIFYLDHDPTLCAQYHGDKHVVKMILETAQLLSSAHRVLDGVETQVVSKNNRKIKTFILGDQIMEDNLYKMTHKNHPCAIWARESSGNYNWLASLLLALLEEYKYRYGKDHLVSTKLDYLKKLPKLIVDGPFTKPATAMPDEYIKPNNSLESYREYYRKGKIPMHSWKGRNKPEWL